MPSALVSEMKEKGGENVNEQLIMDQKFSYAKKKEKIFKATNLLSSQIFVLLFYYNVC